jgi:hypothetical protein
MEEQNGPVAGEPSAAVEPETGPELSSRAEAGSERRGRARTWLLWLAAAVLIAGLAVGGYVVLRQMERVRAAEARLDAAAALLDGAEDNLLRVDEAVQAEISSEIATQAADALPVAQQVRADALAAVVILDEVMPVLGEELLPVAEALKESALARADMMAEAPAILEGDRKAALAMIPADAALVEIKAAEDLITKAVAEFNKHTADGVRASTANSVEAETRLGNARSLLATATAAFPEADFTAFVTYIDAKVALVSDSKEIDSLWLAGKIAESNAKLDAYNKKDAEIVAMAAALPASVRDPIADAYEDLTADPRERYFDARERARAAGDRVRALRGTIPEE